MVFLGLSIIASLILTRRTGYLTNRWFLAGILSALLICFPNILWQLNNGMPVVDHMQFC